MLNTRERNMLRKVYSSVTEQGFRRIRTNQELAELQKTPDLVADIKRRSWEWLWHVTVIA
jgi:hypothetical protein